MCTRACLRVVVSTLVAARKRDMVDWIRPPPQPRFQIWESKQPPHVNSDFALVGSGQDGRDLINKSAGCVESM